MLSGVIRFCLMMPLGLHFYAYTPPVWDLYCSPCRLYGPTYRSFPHIPLDEVMWQPGEVVIQIPSKRS